MEAIAENWFFVLVLLGCIAVHYFGHGHGHGGGNGHEHGKDDSRLDSSHRLQTPGNAEEDT